MQKGYFILVVAHSVKGKIRRIQIPYYAMHAVVALALVGLATVLGAAGSYGRMFIKVTQFNTMRQEVQSLKKRYHDLQGTMSGQKQQLASLHSLATEVSLAYGLKQVTSSPAELDPGERYFRNSIEQYRMLMRASNANPLQKRTLLHDSFGGGLMVPSIWPYEGPVTGSFGERLDPFNGESSLHSGIDISATYGAPVKATADGVVVYAERYAGYGMMVDVEHGRGLVTRYAHLSGVAVVNGQAVRAGEIIGRAGRSGRSTGCHVHYEVRVNGLSVNPMRFMSRQKFGTASAGLSALSPTDEQDPK